MSALIHILAAPLDSVALRHRGIGEGTALLRDACCEVAVLHRPGGIAADGFNAPVLMGSMAFVSWDDLPEYSCCAGLTIQGLGTRLPHAALYKEKEWSLQNRRAGSSTCRWVAHCTEWLESKPDFNTTSFYQC